MKLVVDANIVSQLRHARNKTTLLLRRSIFTQ
jgi:hypothetical protein